MAEEFPLDTVLKLKTPPDPLACRFFICAVEELKTVRRDFSKLSKTFFFFFFLSKMQ